MHISGIIARHNGKDFLEEVHGLCKLTLLRLPDSSAEFFHGFPVLIRRRVPEFNVAHVAIDGNNHDLRNYAVKFPDAVNRVLPGVLCGIGTFSGGDHDVCQRDRYFHLMCFSMIRILIAIFRNGFISYHPFGEMTNRLIFHISLRFILLCPQIRTFQYIAIRFFDFWWK